MIAFGDINSIGLKPCCNLYHLYSEHPSKQCQVTARRTAFNSCRSQSIRFLQSFTGHYPSRRSAVSCIWTCLIHCQVAHGKANLPQALRSVRGFSGSLAYPSSQGASLFRLPSGKHELLSLLASSCFL